jgi:hypothetical protein
VIVARTDHGQNPPALDIRRADIDGDMQGRIRDEKRAQIGHHHLDHLVGDPHDEPARLGQRDEDIGSDHRAVGMMPAYQRLRPDPPPGMQIDDGLVVDDELPLLHRDRELTQGR